MKDSKEKEHRISNLKNMITHIKEDEKTQKEEDIEEDSELIEYLNEDPIDYDNLGINDEFIYHPGDEDNDALNLEEDKIDENYIIKTPKIKDSEETEEEYDDIIMGDISENFDNVVNAKIKGRPILSIVSIILGAIFIIISAFIFTSRTDRVIDNVVSGENSFIFVIFLIIGLLLLIFGIYKLFNVKTPFNKITKDIDLSNNDKKEKPEPPKEKPSPKVIPKSKIPLDKDSYKIGEFNIKDLNTSLKKPAASGKNNKTDEDIEDLPPAKEKTKALSDEELEYEQVKLESESIDDIFAEVEDMDDMPVVSTDSKEKNE